MSARVKCTLEYFGLIVRPFVRPSVHSSVRRSSGQSFHHPYSVHRSVCTPFSPSDTCSRSVNPSVHPSVRPSVRQSVRQSVKNDSRSKLLPEVPHLARSLMHGTSSNGNVSPKHHVGIVTPLERFLCLPLLCLIFLWWTNCFLPKRGFDPGV